MLCYWIRYRFFLTSILCVVMALIMALFFAFPYISQRANNYNSQSVYKSTDVDFNVPEPSFGQVDELVGNHGIDKVFPYFMTKTQISVNGMLRTTTVLLSDRWENVDVTMYNCKRLIEKSDAEYNNPILVDWQFCHDTGANLGDMILFTIDGITTEYRIYAIYETNSIYDGGAVLAYISDEQKESIKQKSKNSGYSGMYISARDYSVCRSFLTTDYRPLGRLKSRELFDSEEQYQIHYDAILSYEYANEITDFHIRENNLEKPENPIMIWLGASLSAILVMVFNFVMVKRGCEEVYFTKQLIPRGKNVRPYYILTFIFEPILFCIFYTVVLIAKIHLSDEYIPRMVLDGKLVVIPVIVIIAEVINLIINYFMISSEGYIRRKSRDLLY